MLKAIVSKLPHSFSKKRYGEFKILHSLLVAKIRGAVGRIRTFSISNTTTGNNAVKRQDQTSKHASPATSDWTRSLSIWLDKCWMTSNSQHWLGAATVRTSVIPWEGDLLLTDPVLQGV
ncbi:uncharacterized protein LOC131207397 [Anopheles bellator]|uniref:uncharacterized protein LOC131207397 n=1 Tax=Anopheles bellator TaxID=139047 RepID=UPI0026475C13|nr:uncharacterized protein LOC131207397 [Anopheles bellator]